MSHGVSLYDGDYYDGIDFDLVGEPLEMELNALISNNIERISYDALWEAFNNTDTVFPSCPGTIHDIYSDKCWEYDVEQCGNYQGEGDCYNREHSWPKSWWGGESANDNAYTDLHHIFPSDGYDNSRRSNYPFGYVIPGTSTFNTSNGSQLGECMTKEYGEIMCWEPADSMKGDLARGYFYMSTRYLLEFNCCDEEGVTDADINFWMELTLRKWHDLDPVDEPEMERNNIIYEMYQGNRNPYIDYPIWVHLIRNF